MDSQSFFAKIPAALLPRSGKVFYSGRSAFSKQSSIYMLGVNPGGDPVESVSETVASHTAAVWSEYADDWSAYRDEAWKGFKPGTYGMAPRILHLCEKLDMNPGQVPASNLVFARSRREADMGAEMKVLANMCWPFHEFVIQQVRPRVVLCFGKTAGVFVCRKLGASTLHSEFVELNQRKWRSQVFVGQRGIRVVIATHPSIADWCSPATDPTSLVEAALD